MRITLLRFYCSTVYLIFNCYFIHVYIVTVFFTLICVICSSVISLCNGAISFVLFYCYIVTLVRLSLVTIKGYLLACTSIASKRAYNSALKILAASGNRTHLVLSRWTTIGVNFLQIVGGGLWPFPSPPLPFPLLPSPLLPSLPFPLLRSRPPNPARGSGERCKLPQRGLGRSPSRNRFLVHFSPKIRWQKLNQLAKFHVFRSLPEMYRR